MHPQHFAFAIPVDLHTHLASSFQFCLSGLPRYFFSLKNLRARIVSDDRSGLVIYSLWVPRRQRRVSPTSTEMITLGQFLRIYISLFIGIICTSSVSLFLLVWIVNDSNISFDSLDHDFQTVYILTTDQWSSNPQLRAAIELRWLWVFSSIVLTIGLFPSERAHQLLRWLASIKTCVRTSLAARSSLTLTPMIGYSIDPFRTRCAMDLSPCTSPSHRSRLTMELP